MCFFRLSLELIRQIINYYLKSGNRKGGKLSFIYSVFQVILYLPFFIDLYFLLIIFSISHIENRTHKIAYTLANIMFANLYLNGYLQKWIRDGSHAVCCELFLVGFFDNTINVRSTEGTMFVNSSCLCGNCSNFAYL